jgi:U3 small nucleolar RNA-associated protein 10
LIAIEHITRALFRVSSGLPRGGSDHLVNALSHSASLAASVQDDATTFASIEASARQLISTIALSAATIVRVLGTRSLPILPKLMNCMSAMLSLTNVYAESCVESDEGEPLAQARLLQLSTMRFLIAVTETLPQFIPHYLKTLLSGAFLLSNALRQGSDTSLLSAVEHLDAILPAQVPARLLVPALTKALAKCKDATECCIMLSMLKMSIETLSSGEAAAHKNAILGCVTALLGREESIANRELLMVAGNAALLALILKLSEVQLRRVYTSLREWTGDFDKSAPATNAGRRYAFWTISASLAKELRSIFLPCLSMVINDAVAELQVAAQKLVPPEKSASGSSPKKRRLAADETSGQYDEYSKRALQPLLLCLERSLRSDALDGGHWVRADGSQRYNAMLEPLGKLLRCKVGPDFPLPEGVSNGFQHLIEGSDHEGGNVVGSLVALGLAAGDEQLWKPLNYAVLEACGSDGRTEVKSAGLTCLLSLIKTLGEEYMVLLPECLPVLSELLEDSSDEISGRARDTVSMAEELLGESLEDSLR